MKPSDTIDSLPEILRPLARWVDEQHERGGIIGRNADTGEPVPESLGEYYRAWSLIRECEAAIRKLESER